MEVGPDEVSMFEREMLGATWAFTAYGNTLYAQVAENLARDARGEDDGQGAAYLGDLEAEEENEWAPWTTGGL